MVRSGGIKWASPKPAGPRISFCRIKSPFYDSKILFEIMCMPSMYHISTSVVVSNGGAPTCTNWHLTVPIFYIHIKVV